MTSYASPVELRVQPGMEQATQDTVLQALLDAATEAINNHCYRPDGFVAGSASARPFPGSGGVVQWIDEAAAVTLVEVKQSPSDTVYTAWASSDWIPFTGDEREPNFNLTPYTGIMIAAPSSKAWFTSGRYQGPFWSHSPVLRPRSVPTVRITAQWGYALTVPAAIKQACIIQAARWYKRGASFWADAVANPDMGGLMYRKTLDPDVQEILENGRFVRPAI